MTKLSFNYPTINAGKSTVLLQASYNYGEQGMNTYLLTADIDGRAGHGRISSRIGISADADTFAPCENLFDKVANRRAVGPIACIFVDEAQFLTVEQVWQLARVVDDLNIRPFATASASISEARSFLDPPHSWPSQMRCARPARSAIAAAKQPWLSAKTQRETS